MSAVRGPAAAPGSPATSRPTLAPYRALFPLGVVFAIAGAVPWILAATGAGGYPAPLHRTLMMQGFEMSFVLGFLLTSIPAFTHGAPCRGWELAGALAGQSVFAACAFAGFEAAAHGAFVATLLGLAAAAARRVVRARLAPPEEFLFVGVGLALGLAGGALQFAAATGAWHGPSPRLAVQLVSLGMMLALVLGVGSMLVPVFAGMRDPLLLPGIAAPHERPRRRRFYVTLASLLALSFGADAFTVPAVGASVRFAVAATLGLLGWKLWRRPGRPTLAAWTLWISGWLMLAGLALAAVLPGRAVAFHHVVFIGGYGLLTLAIGARVVTGHGRHPVAEEARMVTPAVVALVAAAIVLRVAAEFAPRAPHWLAGSAALWILAWLRWAAGALPRILRLAAPAGRTDEVPVNPSRI